MILENQLLSIFQRLNSVQKKIAYDFLQGLARKKPTKIEEGKAILLRTSVWDEESIQKIEEAREHFNSWNPVQYS